MKEIKYKFKFNKQFNRIYLLMSAKKTEKTEVRPFLSYWEHLETLELKRRKGLIPDDRHMMTLAFIEEIGQENFIEEARNVHAMREIARFYGVELREKPDLSELLKKVEINPSHREIFYYGFYFAAWIKQEVPAF